MRFKWGHEFLRVLFSISPLLQPALLFCYFLLCSATRFASQKPSCQQFSKPKPFGGAFPLCPLDVDNFQEQGVSFWQEGSLLSFCITARVSAISMFGIKNKSTSIPQFAMNPFT